MRTTLAIDDDVLAAARRLAEHEQKSIGEVVSSLARQGLSRNTSRSRSLIAGRNARHAWPSGLAR
jgi:hypothetical protein